MHCGYPGLNSLRKNFVCNFRRLESLCFGVAMLPGELVDPEPAELPASLEDPHAFETTFRLTLTKKHTQADFLKCQEVFLKDDMDFQKLAGYVWPQDTPMLFVLPLKCLHGFASTMVEALSQAQAGAIPFMKIPSALRSAERAAGLPSQ